ncbi:MAG: hypothetical protein AAGF15_11070 [Pseudomonadota bacterium]
MSLENQARILMQLSEALDEELARSEELRASGNSGGLMETHPLDELKQILSATRAELEVLRSARQAKCAETSARRAAAG